MTGRCHPGNRNPPRSDRICHIWAHLRRKRLYPSKSTDRIAAGHICLNPRGRTRSICMQSCWQWSCIECPPHCIGCKHLQGQGVVSHRGARLDFQHAWCLVVQNQGNASCCAQMQGNAHEKPADKLRTAQMGRIRIAITLVVVHHEALSTYIICLCAQDSHGCCKEDSLL